MNRRRFLRQSGQWTLGALSSSWSLPLLGSGLSACSTIDRVFSVEKTDFDEEVIIVGGGPAGLMAALACKKRKVPYRIFEMTERMGGRARAVSIVSKSGDEEVSQLDMGVDTVDERHRVVFDVCRELNLELVEKKISSRWDDAFVWDSEKFLPLQKSRSEFEHLFSKITTAQLKSLGDRRTEDWESKAFADSNVVRLDQMSLRAFMTEEKIKLSPEAEAFLGGWCLSNWGRGIDQVSALAFILFIDPENRGPTQYRLRGGFGGLTQTMYERSAGVISDFLTKSGYQLVEVEGDDGKFYCTFNVSVADQNGLVTKTHFERIKCRRLVISIPISQLGAVAWRGDLKAPMKPWTVGQFGQLAPQTKSYHSIIQGSPNRLPKNKFATASKRIYRFENEEDVNLASILSFSGAFTPEGKGFPTSLGYNANPIAYLDWSRQAGVGGARWNQGTGNITSYQQWKMQFAPKGKLAFAGEFESTTYPGTLEAALASGALAVTSVLS